MGKQAAVRIWRLPLAVTVICGCVCGLAASVRAEESSQAACAAAALARPDNVGSSMSRPGNKWQQEVRVAATFRPTSADCLSLVRPKTPRAFFKMQRPKNHRQWTRTKGQGFVDQEGDQPIGDEGGIGSVSVGPPPGRPKPLKHFLYRCTPGKGVTDVRAVIILKVTSAEDGSLLGRRSYSWPVKVESIPFAFGGGVKGPC